MQIALKKSPRVIRFTLDPGALRQGGVTAAGYWT
jgi:hypothetical protein